MSYLSENITALMNQRGLNATTLAQATGVPQPTIHRILRGVSKDPRTDTIKPLADFFGVPVETLRTTFVGTTLRRTVAQARQDFEASVQQGQKNSSARISAVSLALRDRSASFVRELKSILEADNRVFKNEQLDRASGYRFDYVSPSVIAEFTVLTLRARYYPFPVASTDGRPLRASVVDVVASRSPLWRLSCVRLLDQQQPTISGRQYLLFLDTVAMADDLDTRPVASQMARIIFEAQLHGIQVFWCGPHQAAQLVAAAEKGEKINSMSMPEEHEQEGEGSGDGDSPE